MDSGFDMLGQFQAETTLKTQQEYLQPSLRPANIHGVGTNK